MTAPTNWALASAACMVIAGGIIAYAWRTRDRVPADPRTAIDAGWLNAATHDASGPYTDADDADTRALIHDAEVAELDAIPVPGKWDIPTAWHALGKTK